MPPKKPFEVLRPPAVVEGRTVVPSPIPRETLERRPATEIPVEREPDASAVPGSPADLEAVEMDGDVIEMVGGQPLKRPAPKASFFNGMPDEWPHHLTSEVLLKPSQGGQPSTQSLRPPRGVWMRVDEIKFEVFINQVDNPGTVFATYAATGIGAVIGAGLKLGDVPLTSGFVPVAMFGPSRKLTAERGLVIPAGATDSAGSRVEDYVWPLAVPIYVPPGRVIEVAFEHRGFLDYLVRARVSFSGVLLSTPPSMVERSKLPFASAWSSPAMPLDGSTHTSVSSDKDLVGPEDKDFHVEYLLGRTYVATQTSTFKALIEQDLDQSIAPVGRGVGEALHNQVDVRMTTSWGAPLVQDYVPFPAVFDRLNRQLEAPCVLPGEGFLTADVQSSANANDSSMLALVSLVGWQEVAP